MPGADISLSYPEQSQKVLGGMPWGSLRGQKCKFCPRRTFPGKAEGFQEQETLLIATGIQMSFLLQVRLSLGRGEEKENRALKKERRWLQKKMYVRLWPSAQIRL